MCGIAGVVRFGDKRPSQDEVERMTRAIAHRGPDGDGVYLRDNVALGHRRLSIIDLAGGKQPMANEDETVWVTFNGEIYNYKQLASQLRDLGHKFRTNSDTEVLVHGYEQWGESLVRRLRGMFAFAIADFNNRQLLLARDHLGIKPLVYHLGDDFVAFASELAAIKQVDGIQLEGDLLAVDRFLRFQYVPTPHTIYRRTYKLPPAHTMLIDFDGKRKPPKRYWNVTYQPQRGRSDVDWIEEVSDAVRESVKAQLIADVPLGVFLSGGIDSTLVAGEMSELLSHPVHAFSIGFDEKEYSELRYAEQAAKRFGIQLHTEIVQASSIDLADELLDHYGEPFGDSSMIPTWYVARLARRHVPMVLAGDGGDEVFAGYDTYGHMMNGYPHRRPPSTWQRAARRKVKHLAHRVRTGRDWFSWKWRSFMYGGFFNEDRRKQLWLRQHEHLADHPYARFDELGRQALDSDQLGFAQYLDLNTYLPDDILTKVDIASMAHGLEVRPPILDPNVIETAARLPETVRLRRDGDGRWVGKWVLKKLVGRHFAADFVHRQKQGFSIPRASWLTSNPAAEERLRFLAESDESPLLEWFDRDKLAEYGTSNNSNGADAGRQWLLLILGSWRMKNLDINFH